MSHPDRFLLAGVMGWPVMHSRSPMLHNHWLRQYDLAGSYVPLAIRPEGLAAALRALLPFIGHPLGMMKRCVVRDVTSMISGIPRSFSLHGIAATCGIVLAFLALRMSSLFLGIKWVCGSMRALVDAIADEVGPACYNISIVAWFRRKMQ